MSFVIPRPSGGIPKRRPNMVRINETPGRRYNEAMRLRTAFMSWLSIESGMKFPIEEGRESNSGDLRSSAIPSESFWRKLPPIRKPFSMPRSRKIGSKRYAGTGHFYAIDVSMRIKEWIAGFWMPGKMINLCFGSRKSY